MREQNVAPEVRTLLSEANQAYVIDNDRETALAKLMKVISLSPGVRSAWASMAVMFRETEQSDKALQCRIMEAYLTSRPLNLWADAADESYSKGDLRQAEYCLAKAEQSSQMKDRSDVIDLMFQRAKILHEELGTSTDLKKAAAIYKRMLEYTTPFASAVVIQLASVYYDLQLPERAIDILQQSADWHFATFEDPQIDTALLGENNTPGAVPSYSMNEIATLADLHLQTSNPGAAVHAIRRGVRWQQGRHHQTFWDEVEDDREFDEARGIREVLLGRHIELAEVYELDVGLRFLLGVARARLNDIEEALSHLEIWESRYDVDIIDDFDRYGQLVDAYLDIASRLAERTSALGAFDIEEQGRLDSENAQRDHILKKALDIAERVNEEDMEESRQPTNVKRLATCLLENGRVDDAIDYLNWVVEADGNDLDSKMRLAEVYEQVGGLDNTARAMELLGQGENIL